MFGDDGFTFLDFLDIINPLQHIPVVSTIYRDLTGDTLDYGSRVAGGTLFGGPIGALASVVNVIFEETTGKDVGAPLPSFSINNIVFEVFYSWHLACNAIHACEGNVNAMDEPSVVGSTQLAILPGGGGGEWRFAIEHVMALFTDDSPDDDGTMTAQAVPEADFETAAGGTVNEPESDIPWTSPLPAPVKELALAPLPPSPSIAAPQPIAPPAHGEGGQWLSNRSFLTEDSVAGPAATGGGASPHSPIGAPLRPTAANKQDATPSDTMAALLRESEKESDAYAAIQQRKASAMPGSPKADHAEAGEATRPPAGAVASEGGWFSEVMLSAFAKYQESAELARTTLPTVSLTN